MPLPLYFAKGRTHLVILSNNWRHVRNALPTRRLSRRRVACILTGRPESRNAEHRPIGVDLGRFDVSGDVLDQLDLTYDLYSMSSDELAELLPHEFAVYLKLQ